MKYTIIAHAVKKCFYFHYNFNTFLLQNFFNDLYYRQELFCGANVIENWDGFLFPQLF